MRGAAGMRSVHACVGQYQQGIHGIDVDSVSRGVQRAAASGTSLRRHAQNAYLRHPPPIEIGQRARSTLNFELETLNSWFLDFGF